MAMGRDLGSGEMFDDDLSIRSHYPSRQSVDLTALRLSRGEVMYCDTFVDRCQIQDRGILLPPGLSFLDDVRLCASRLLRYSRLSFQPNG